MGSHGCFVGGVVVLWVGGSDGYSKSTPWRRPEGGHLGHPIICNAKSTTRRLQETHLSQWRACTRYEATHTYDEILLFQGFLFFGGEGFWRLTVHFFLHDWNSTPKAWSSSCFTWKTSEKWDQIQFKPLPTHALFTSGQTTLSIHSLQRQSGELAKRHLLKNRKTRRMF